MGIRALFLNKLQGVIDSRKSARDSSELSSALSINYDELFVALVVNVGCGRP